MNEIENLQNQINELKKIIDFLVFPDRYLFQRDIELFNGKNIKIGVSTGTKIGQSNSKIAFFGATPVVQQPFIAYPSGGATVDSQARSAVTSVITTLQQVGINLPS